MDKINEELGIPMETCVSIVTYIKEYPGSITDMMAEMNNWTENEKVYGLYTLGYIVAMNRLNVPQFSLN